MLTLNLVSLGPYRGGLLTFSGEAWAAFPISLDTLLPWDGLPISRHSKLRG